jgi:RNA polymerase sigma-70 factor (ECF subfamily)
MEELLNGCKKKDIRAQKQLYDKFAPLMMSVCMRYTGDREVAENILQDGFIKVFDKIHTYSGTGSFVAWMKAIFTNASLEYLRQNDVLRNSSDIEDAYFIESKEESALDKISADEIMRCIEELPSGYRTVFNLFAVEEYTHAEIAEKLGIQESSSRSQYNRAKLMLQKKIKELNKIK